MNQLQDDEIDLMELLLRLWDGKWQIIAATFIATTIGFVFSSLQPNSYRVSTTIENGSQSVFLPYLSLNDLLREKELLFDSESNPNGFSFNSVSVFNMFVAEFNDYKEMVGALTSSAHVRKSIEGLSEKDKQKALINLAKSFKLQPPTKNNKKWLLSYTWHDESEGSSLFYAALQQTLINVQTATANNINELAMAIDTGNTRKLQNLNNMLSLLELQRRETDNARIQYLTEQAAIATELGIEPNLLDKTALSESSQNGDEFNFSLSHTPYYLRGSKAINKEIALIRNRSDEEALLMSEGYLEIKQEIILVENDLSSNQLKNASKAIANDSPTDWVSFDLTLVESVSQKKSILFIALAAVLGGILGALFVLISHAVRNYKKARQTS